MLSKECSFVKNIKLAKPNGLSAKRKELGMDNRRRVSRKVLRQRQLGALAVIALIVLLFVVLLAKCTKNAGEGGSSKADSTTTTTTLATTTVPPETTTTVPTTTANPKAQNVRLSKREIFLDIGETDVPIIQSYPDAGTGEADEVWKSMDPTIAVVNNSGYITGVSKGQTYIILSFKNYPDIEIEIKVNVADDGSAAVTAADSDSSTTSTTVAAGVA